MESRFVKFGKERILSIKYPKRLEETFKIGFEESFKIGIEEERKEERERSRLLIRKLIDSGRFYEIPYISSSKENWKKALDEFGLSPNDSKKGEP